jgi:hypothetical protein
MPSAWGHGVEYRAFFLDKSGHIQRRQDFEAADDESALRHAKQWLDRADIEVWQLGRVVGKLQRNK